MSSHPEPRVLAAQPLGASSCSAPSAAHSRAQRRLIAATLCGIVALQLVGAGVWLWNNTITIGHDASKYLLTSLEYTRFFNLSPQGLYQAFTYDPYRPPAFFLAVQPFYALFGPSADASQLVNVLLLAVVICLVYWLGVRVASSPGVGLFAALLVAFLPMMTAMSRLFYTEMLLTALVALNLLALYCSQGFSRRGWSLAWGASLGVGLLVKWTMPIYVILPLAWFLWRGGVLRAAWVGRRGVRLGERRAFLAVVMAAGVAALWVWPNRAVMGEVVAWQWQFLGWWLIGALLLVGLLRSPSPVNNLWTASLLAVAIASLWYLPHADFGWRLLAVDEERGAAGAHPLSWMNYWRYVRYVYWEHFGPLAFWLIVPGALAPWVWGWLKRRSLQPSATPLWYSTAGALCVLFVISQANARNLAPLLPGAAILATIGLCRYPKPWRIGVGALWVVVLATQWSLFTFDGLFGVYGASEPLWARSSYLMQPASGPTDAGYAISGDVLDRVAAGSDERQFLAMLVNIPSLHRGGLRAEIMLQGRNVRIKDITEDRANPWYDLLTSEWALVKDGDNRDVEGSAHQVIQEILGDNGLFHALYREEARYTLPNGETVFLYGRAAPPYGYPQMMPELLAATESAAGVIRDGWSGHASLAFANRDLAFWIALHGGPNARAVVQTDAAETPELFFTHAAPKGDTIFVVTDPASDQWLPWLNEHAYHAYAAGGDFAGLDIYGWPQKKLDSMAVGAAWPKLALTGVRSQTSAAPGQVLPLETTWRGAEEGELKVSYRLIAPDGASVAAFDRPLTVNDRLGLFIPPTAPAGVYTVAVIVYDPTTLEPIADTSGATPTPLFQLQVGPG